MTTPRILSAAELLPCPFCGTEKPEVSKGLNAFEDCEITCTCGANVGNFDVHGNEKGAFERNYAEAAKAWNTRQSLPAAPQDGDFDEPSKTEAVFMGINDMRLMVDPSVPQEMILFPDEATRKWFTDRNERLIDALKCIRKHIGKMQDNNPGYDFNADPLSTTLIEGWINTALDTEEFCPDWMCQHECLARESLKEHLEERAALSPPPVPDGDALKALEALDAIVKAYCMSLGMKPPIPDEGSQTAEQVRTIRASLASSVQGVTVEEITNEMVRKMPSEIGKWLRDKLEQSPHGLKIKGEDK